MSHVVYVLLGVVAGIFSGMFGIGGGIILIPALVYIFGLTQHQAQGTTLALMLPPIGLLAAWTYYKQGYINIPTALFICLGFFIGGFFGAKIAVHIPDAMLRKFFGIFLLLISIHMIFTKK